MAFNEEQLRKIYDRTSGYCHLCGKKLSFKNYGKYGTHAPWEVEHSIPRSKGGSNHMNNLYPSCISCNKQKGNAANKSVRSKYGITKAPLSIPARKKAKIQNAAWAGVTGGVIGYLLGPIGSIAGVVIGASIGYEKNPDIE